ncbi:WW domain-containing protein [Phanerochaete sordida]|uniref:WW domain-containing protein n=1 Tax=Phanerochaete sordida TaxID=48140 RepID=A0A9P3G169_9APHY|nr:WW domain-containing protein [Phanerochaete sordida]
MTSPASSPSPRPASPSADGAPAAKRQKVDHEDDGSADGASPDRSDSDEPSAEHEPQAGPSANAASSGDASASASAATASGSASDAPPLPMGVATATAGDWQAVWSPSHNAYYFYNAKTQETTWTNPLQPEASSSTAAPSASPDEPEASTSTPATSSLYAMQAAAAAQGIDPALAYLDPSLAAGTSSAPSAFSYTAKFNARTGAFTKPDGRDPTHVSEYERARRMSEAYFDVGQWEQDVEQRNAQEEAEGKKKKKPSKKDLERFKEQKRLKKIAKTAWLRT